VNSFLSRISFSGTGLKFVRFAIPAGDHKYDALISGGFTHNETVYDAVTEGAYSPGVMIETVAFAFAACGFALLPDDFFVEAETSPGAREYELFNSHEGYRSQHEKQNNFFPVTHSCPSLYMTILSFSMA
jgi:hypothetical protein